MKERSFAGGKGRGGALDLFLRGVLRQMYRFKKTTFFHSLPPFMRARLGAGRLASSRTPNHPGHSTIPAPGSPSTPDSPDLDPSDLDSSNLDISPTLHFCPPLFHPPLRTFRSPTLLPPSTLSPSLPIASPTFHSSTRLSHPPLFSSSTFSSLTFHSPTLDRRFKPPQTLTPSTDASTFNPSGLNSPPPFFSLLTSTLLTSFFHPRLLLDGSNIHMSHPELANIRISKPQPTSS